MQRIFKGLISVGLKNKVLKGKQLKPEGGAGINPSAAPPPFQP